MTVKPDETWTEWMAAEAAGDEDRADAALRVALHGVSRAVPSPELSHRLLSLATTVRPERAGRRSDRLIALSVIGGALVMTLLPVGVLGVLFVVDAGRTVSWLARACVWVTELLSAGVSIWSVLARTGGGLGRAAASPVGSLVLTLTLLLASSALLALNRFLPEERRS
jgi:hypothetical protein